MGTRIVRPETAFSTSPKRAKHPRKQAGEHLKWVRSLPSVLSGKRPCEAAHIRFADPRYCKRETGGGEKPDDRWVLPLTPDEHRTGPEAQHATGDERKWWAARGIDPVAVAAALWAVTNDEDRDEQADIILKWARETVAVPERER